MEFNRSYLFVFLLASLNAPCTSNCFTFERYSQPDYHECTKFYSMFEAALLKNNDNLFELQDNLFPSSSSEPNYAMVSFNVHQSNESRRECYTGKIHCYDTCWTTSLLLKSVNPFVLYSLQLQLLNLLIQLVGASELTGLCVHLDFELTVNFTGSDSKRNHIINEVLQDLTTWVSVIKKYTSTPHFFKHALLDFSTVIHDFMNAGHYRSKPE